MDEDEIRRLQAINRRAWGAALLSTGILLFLVGAIVLLAMLWVLSQEWPH